MKISRLLVLNALWAVSLSASAADLNERTAPEYPETGVVETAAVDQTPQVFASETAYVLYNVGAQMYFCGANDYQTRASIQADPAPIVYFTTTSASKAKGSDVYELKDYVVKFSNPMSTFATDANNIWVDNNGASGRFWKISGDPQGYRIQNVDVETELFLGWKGSEDDTRLYLIGESEGSINWQLFPADQAWSDYAKAVVVYNASEDLKAIILRAEEMGKDVSAAVAVYNNEAATVEEIEAAIAALQKELASGIDQGTAENPSDATGLINNPNFDNASAAGWEGNTPNMVGSGSHGPANVAEIYNATYDTYQNLSGLPVGVYGLSANTTFRGNFKDFENHTPAAAVLYASADGVEQKSPFVNMWAALCTTNFSGATEFGPTASATSAADGDVTYYAPNDPSYARVMFEAGYYQNTVFFHSNGEARIGVKNEAKCTHDPESEQSGCDNWSIFDTFSLKYYGNEPAAYQKWVEESAPKFAEGITVTTSYMEAYKSMVSGKSASDAASAQAAVEEIKASAELYAIYDNQRAWAQFSAMLSKAQAVMVDPSTEDFAGELAEFIQEHDEDFEDLSLTTEELLAACEEIKRLIEKTIEDAKNDVKEGQEVTNSYLTNANFNNGGTGWTTGKGKITYRAGIAEAYDTNFDVYQDVENPKVGVYKLELKGFFRMQRDDTALQMYNNNEQTTDAGVYVGTTLSQNKTYLKCVFEEAVTPDNETLYATGGMWEDANTGNRYPNTMESAAPCFAAGMYQNEAYGLVSEAGETMRVGVSGNVTGANWICWDDFRLTYMGMDAATISPILAKAAEELDLSELMGKDVYEEANAVKTAAENQVGGSDGQAMFDALKGIFAIRDKVATSVALFKNLIALKENEFIPAMNNPVNTAASGEAGELFDALDQGLDPGNCAYTDADVPALIARMKSVMQWLQVPDDDIAAAATDDAPVDMTGAILTNEFSDSNGQNSITWWEGTEGYNFGNNDELKSTMQVEFFNKTFNMYQDIEHLPNGTYEVKVSAFGRFGGIAEDYAKKQSGEGNESFLYATSGDVTASAPLKFLFDGAQQNSIADGEATYEADGVTWYVPNDMISFVSFKQFYENSIIVKVTDNKLRVGINKPQNTMENGWVIMDSWKLTYFGANSSKVATEDGIDTIAAGQQQAEYFTLDGRKATSAQKGLVIVKMGNKVVKRIQK